MGRPRQEVGHASLPPASNRITGTPEISEDPEAILESVGLHVHLVGANFAADPDIVFAANHVERVRDGEDVRAALKGRESAITQKTRSRPRTLVEVSPQLMPPGCAGMPSSAICNCRYQRRNVVENPVEADIDLVDVRSEKMWVSETATLRPWLLMFCVLPKHGSAKPGARQV